MLEASWRSILVIRKSHFISICLLALASSIALTEYVMYSPTIIQDSDESDFWESFTGDENTTEQESISPIDNAPSKHQEESSTHLDIVPETVEPNPPDVIEEAEPMKRAPFTTSNEHKVIINKGDTLTSLLENLGFDRTEVYLASKALAKVFNLRNLKVGQEITIHGEKNKDGELQLKDIEIKPDSTFKIIATKLNDGSFFAERRNTPIKKVIRNISGSMSVHNPAFSLKQCGVKPKVSSEALRVLNTIVNLKESRSPVDFEFLYYDAYDMDGNLIPGKTDLLYAAALVNGSIKKVYNFDDGNNREYVDSTGTILKTLAQSKSM
ncbi:MAG: hypothetical protein LBE97_02685, partial [Holosporales bacterium]|nr:hypothetical protein [Holosporales bacterium]